MAMPLTKPVMTELGTKRNMEPSFNRPRTSMIMPVIKVNAKSDAVALSPECTWGTLATIKDMALVVCTLMNTELANKAPIGVANITA